MRKLVSNSSHIIFGFFPFSVKYCNFGQMNIYWLCYFSGLSGLSIQEIAKLWLSQITVVSQQHYPSN